MKLLHISAAPRENKSRTLQVADAFLACLHARYPNLRVEVIDLFKRDSPAVAGENIESKYELMYGRPIDKRHAESWKQIEREIEHFLSADFYLISTPMWNFSIPYDFQEPYLRAIFGFVGITDIHFINAQPMDMLLVLREAALDAAISQARQLAETLDWDVHNAASQIENPAALEPCPLEHALAVPEERLPLVDLFSIAPQ